MADDRTSKCRTWVRRVTSVARSFPTRFGTQLQAGWSAVAVGLFVVPAATPARAASAEASDSIEDAVVTALSAFLRALFEPVQTLIQRYGNDLIHVIVGTPHPNAVFESPTNGPWPAIYEYYWSTIVPLALLLYGLSLGLVILLESTSHLFSNYHRGKLTKRAFSGLVGVLTWWWVAAFSLRFMNALAGFLVPDLSELTLFQTLSFGAMGLLGFVIALGTDFLLFALIALIYLGRHIALYLYVLLMPLLIVLWIPGVGPFGLLSGFMKRLAGFYVPFLFVPVPIALLFRLGELLGSSVDLSMGGVGAWLAGLVIPIVAVVSPFVFFWQAGALFFVADRAANRVSTRQARTRMNTLRRGGARTVTGSRNFLRGARGRPALGRDGDHPGPVTDSQSRAYAVGTRVGRTGSGLRGGLRERFSDSDRTADGADSDADSASESTASDTGGADAADRMRRSAGFRHLDDRRSHTGGPGTSRDSDADEMADESNDDSEDRPRYIH